MAWGFKRKKKSNVVDEAALKDNLDAISDTLPDVDVVEQAADSNSSGKEELNNASKKRGSASATGHSLKSFISSMTGFMKDVMVGDVLVSDLLQRQIGYILLIFVLSLCYINNRFLYEKQLRELNAAKLELEDVKYRSLSMSKNLMQTGRRTAILQQLNNHGSDLQEATSPIIIIKD